MDSSCWHHHRRNCLLMPCQMRGRKQERSPWRTGELPPFSRGVVGTHKSQRKKLSVEPKGKIKLRAQHARRKSRVSREASRDPIR